MRVRFVSVLFASAALLIGSRPTSAADDTFAPIIGTWEHHGISITVNDDGTGEAVWRVYRWCGPDVAEQAPPAALQSCGA